MQVSRTKKTNRGVYIGACPSCGDDVYWYKNKTSHKRFCRCANPDCLFSGPIPQKGTLYPTGITCKMHGGILLGVETWPTDNPADCRRYFWETSPNPRPCVNCREHAKCIVITEAADGLGEDWAKGAR
jgi:ssDNA-binding Zn-finger/Zn-ribbon topoisomerase 1